MLVESLSSATRQQLVTIKADAPLIEAAKLLHQKQIGLVIVCNQDGPMVGVITKTDVVRQISQCQGNSCMTSASSVMTRDVTSCHPDIMLRDAWLRMKERGLKHIPVIDKNFCPVGVLNARQAVQALLNEIENEEELLRDYVAGVGYR